jgi:SpoVK/Ycf46/Vps4 family AAA+-type ATPase
MDAIVKRREKQKEEEARLDPTSEMLTTSMLPKLAHLHDRAQVIFFFATNHRRDLDSAITRPGRFDIWLCIGPPKWSAKLESLDKILERFDVPTGSVERARQVLTKWLDDSGTDAAELVKELDYFTFAEVQSFLEYVCRSAGRPITELDTTLEQSRGRELRDKVRHWYNFLITLREDGPASTRAEYEEDAKQSKLQ